MILFPALCFGQVINKPFDYFEVDIFENIYTVNNKELVKHNSAGVVESRFSSSFYGNITSVDVTNPLEILLFYKNSSTIGFLNQYLSEIGDFIDLYEKVNIEPTLVCQSRNGGVWAYSDLNKRIHKINSKHSVEISTQSIDGFLNAIPHQLIEYENVLYLVSSDRILYFDMYGLYLGSIFLNVNSDIQFYNNSIIYFKNGMHYQYKLKQKALDSIAIPITRDFVDAKFIANKLLIQSKSGLSVENN